jgi:endothelin-converting enzyme/putative endopeptidase
VPATTAPARQRREQETEMVTKYFVPIMVTASLAACSEPEGNGANETAASAETAAPERAALGAWGVDLTARDETVQPGDDFHRYANGHWLDTFEIPSDLPSYGSFVELRLEAEDDIRAIVEELAAKNPQAGTLEQKVGDFYGAWMDTARLDALGTEPLAPHLAEIAAIDSKEKVSLAFASLHNTAPFTVGIIPDPADTTRYAVFVSQDGLGMPDREYYLDQAERFVEYRAAYKTYVTRILSLAGFPDPESKADAIIALETRIAEVHWLPEDSRDIQKIYNPMPAEEVAKLAPEIRWNMIFDRLGLGDVPTFVVGETTAIADAAKIFDETPLDLIKDYLAFHFIRNHARYLSSDFDAANFEFYDRTLRGVEQQRERWKRGVLEVNGGIGEAVGQIYVERHFPPDYKAQMDALVANLVAAMRERLEQNEWMDEETRAKALVKLGTFEPRIGYTEKWTDYSTLSIEPGNLLDNAVAVREFNWQQQVERLAGPVDRALWPYPPQTVNASYNPLLNQITFPAGILQPPFFDPNADPAVNYGAIGAVIGHEIGHGFDDQGRRFDELGRIIDWWTPTADELFSERSTRLGAQYETYMPVPDMNVNGKLTMGENIGDLGGIQMAYAAYHRYLDATSNGEAPVIDGLTGDQRFFLAFAQVWRSKLRDDALRALVLTDPHSPPRFRTNGVVRNVDAWYEAFNVTSEHALYLPPEERVRIW